MLAGQMRAHARLITNLARARFSTGASSLDSNSGGLSAHSLFEVRGDDKRGVGDYIVASVELRPGDVAWTAPVRADAADGRAPHLLPAPTEHTMMLRAGVHWELRRGLPGAELTAHSCDPNCDMVALDAAGTRSRHGDSGARDAAGIVDLPAALALVARRPVRRGEVLSFDYDTWEWEASHPFECACGAAGCRARVAGFSRITDAVRQAALLPRASPFVSSKWPQQ